MTEPTPGDAVRLNVNVPRDLYEQFQRVAAANERSAGAEIRWMMRLAVELFAATERPEGK